MSEPHKIALDAEQKEWLGKMTAEERLELIREICIDWDGYRDADHLGDLLNEVWTYAAFPVAKKDPQSVREPKTAYWIPSSQTARVMTLEELDAIYQTKERHIWPFNTPPWLWMTVNPDVRQTRGFWICWRDIMYCLENDSPFYVRENYGKVWKIWTAEPTDEQREAVKWDE